MKRFFKSVAVILLCGALLAPATEAQNRGRNSSPAKAAPARTRPATGTQARPVTGGASNTGSASTSGRPASSQRPSAQPGRPSGNAPSAQPGRPSGNAPSAQPGRPSGNPPSAQPGRPSGNPPSAQPGRPSGNNPGGSFGGQRPNYQPAPPPPGPPGRPGAGPARPNMPMAPHAWHRPAPPPSWRPPVAWRPFSTILGITLGATINASVNALIRSGYSVSQYGNNSVYVYNVPMLNLIWPDAVLYYNNVGGLCGSRFIYTTGFYDMTRYNSTYAQLVQVYGSPYSVQNTASGIEANWWGPANQYIALSFTPQYTATGSVAYYTTLSFGN